MAVNGWQCDHRTNRQACYQCWSEQGERIAALEADLLYERERRCECVTPPNSNEPEVSCDYHATLERELAEFKAKLRDIVNRHSECRSYECNGLGEVEELLDKEEIK